jgi:hypothetical protein
MPMTEYERAQARADAARARLASTMGALQQKLNPRTLMLDAWSEVRERGHELGDVAIKTARERPVAAVSLIVALVAFLARGSIWDLLRHALFERKADETAGDVAGSDRNETQEEIVR